MYTLCKYPKWWLKTLPVKSLKLACDGLLRALQHKELVQDVSIRYSPSLDVKKQKFLEQWVKEGMNANEIPSVIAGMFTVRGH